MCAGFCSSLQQLQHHVLFQLATIRPLKQIFPKKSFYLPSLQQCICLSEGYKGDIYWPHFPGKKFNMFPQSLCFLQLLHSLSYALRFFSTYILVIELKNLRYGFLYLVHSLSLCSQKCKFSKRPFCLWPSASTCGQQSQKNKFCKHALLLQFLGIS